MSLFRKRIKLKPHLPGLNAKTTNTGASGSRAGDEASAAAAAAAAGGQTQSSTAPESGNSMKLASAINEDVAGGGSGTGRDEEETTSSKKGDQKTKANEATKKAGGVSSEGDKSVASSREKENTISRGSISGERHGGSDVTLQTSSTEVKDKKELQTQKEIASRVDCNDDAEETASATDSVNDDLKMNIVSTKIELTDGSEESGSVNSVASFPRAGRRRPILKPMPNVKAFKGGTTATAPMVPKSATTSTPMGVKPVSSNLKASTGMGMKTATAAPAASVKTEPSAAKITEPANVPVVAETDGSVVMDTDAPKALEPAVSKVVRTATPALTKKSAPTTKSGLTLGKPVVMKTDLDAATTRPAAANSESTPSTAKPVESSLKTSSTFAKPATTTTSAKSTTSVPVTTNSDDIDNVVDAIPTTNSSVEIPTPQSPMSSRTGEVCIAAL